MNTNFEGWKEAAMFLVFNDEYNIEELGTQTKKTPQLSLKGFQ